MPLAQPVPVYVPWSAKGEPVLRKDAKIALVVILLLMVLVVIIWGRSPRPEAQLDPYIDEGDGRIFVFKASTS